LNGDNDCSSNRYQSATVPSIKASDRPDKSLSDRLHQSNAYDLIANDEESCDLQHLLNQFVSSEKMKQQSRQPVLMSNKPFGNLRPVSNRLSLSVGNLNTIPGRQATSQKFSPNFYTQGRINQNQKRQQPAKLGPDTPGSHGVPNTGISSQISSNDQKINAGRSIPSTPDSSTGFIAAENVRYHDQKQNPMTAVGFVQSPSPPAQVDRQKQARIFGLSDKANKNKYLQLASSRQAPNAGTARVFEPPSASNSENSRLLMPANDAPDSPKILSNSEPVGRLLNERLADQLMQLTDDEKVQYIIASHTRHQASDKHSPTSSPDAASISEQRSLLAPDKQAVKPKLKETPKNNFLQPRNHQPANATNLSKYKSLSCDSLNKNLIDFKSYQGPQMIDYSSPFDYAKTRFINSFILSGLKVSDNKQQQAPSQNLVSETRSKLLGKNAMAAKQPADATDSKPLFKRSAVDANVIKIPVRNPVKPYLSRGSVAERVLLFEKCPEIQAQRRSLVQTSRRSKSPVLYRHWKNPSKEKVCTACTSPPYLNDCLVARDSSGMCGKHLKRKLMTVRGKLVQHSG
jgi:hypothetical protein